MAKNVDAPGPSGSRPPSRQGRVQVTAHVEFDVRRELRKLAASEDVTVQHLLCRAINDLFEKYGLGRPADETMLPRGGAAHRGAQIIKTEPDNE